LVLGLFSVSFLLVLVVFSAFFPRITYLARATSKLVLVAIAIGLRDYRLDFS
jgi:hypothetical protein